MSPSPKSLFLRPRNCKIKLLLFLTFCNKIKNIKTKKKEYKKIYQKKNVYSVKKLFVITY